MTAIGIDIGGTKIKAVAIDADGNVLHQLHETTNDGDDKVWKNAVAGTAKELQNLLKKEKINIGLSAPGLPNENKMTAIGIDIGGTKIKAVAIDADGNVLHQLHETTNDGDDKVWKNAVAGTAKELQNLLKKEKINIGLSAPGLPNENNTAIAFMPGRMQGLENLSWKDVLLQPTYVLNDAVAAMMGEVKFGAAKNKKNVVMLTLGTGVGGAILIDGKPYQGAFKKAGHIGHMVINDEGDADITGMPGSLEECIGNCTVEKRSKGKFTSTHELLKAYKNGDAFSKDVWLKSVRQLAIGLASVTNILSPEVIVLGGGITQAGKDLFEPLKEYMSQYEWRAGGNKTEIVQATYGDMAGAIGAACFAMSK